MSTPSTDPDFYLHLRKEAEARLKAGTSPALGAWTLGADALQLLYRLSSDPAKADDALKLLHELQVHQVELDLQLSQMEDAERELAEDLARFRELFNFAPFGYLIIDRAGTIIEANPTGAELFGVAPDALTGRHLEDLLVLASRAVVQGFLRGLSEGSAVCAVTTADARPLRLSARLAPDDDSVLLACFEDTPAPHS